MNLLLLLEMAAAGRPGLPAVVGGGRSLTAEELQAAAWSAASRFAGLDAVAYVGTNGLGFPVALFGAAAAGVPFVPLNYRLGAAQLASQLEPLGRTALVLADAGLREVLGPLGGDPVDADELLAVDGDQEIGLVPEDAEGSAVLLYTSGTTAAPKAAVLRHRHLTSYIVGTVEFGGAGEEEAVLVSVPAYHVAGVANLLSNLYAGRRIVYLPQFDARTWVDAVRAESITNAMVVPTMLARIVDIIEADGAGLPSLRTLAYGGARTPAPVLQRIMDLLPDVSFTNAYGLTETSSTISVLGPDDHRAARDGDPVAIGRLPSAGRVLPTVEIEIRDLEGAVLPVGEVGEVFVRGEQVSGEYVGAGDVREDGWFPTRDRARLDDGGYLFIEGRGDDTIIRGGENIAPAEIEDVLLSHPDVEECAVVGVPDDEWGQRIAAAIVVREGAEASVDDVRAHVRGVLRSSKTPDEVVFVDELPYTETGKLLRRVVLADLSEAVGRS